ncbi:MAG: VCBS repeat-containing protein, partial [Alteromonadales bacterium]|nr:VCBS repeat-containing protein [Alteromonadales bacterium]
MKIRTLNKSIIAMSLFSFATSSASIELGSNANNRLILTGDNSAFIAGNTVTPQLQQVFLNNKKVLQLMLPKQARLYDYGYWGDTNQINAVALTATGIYKLSEQEPELIISSESLYSVMDVSKFKHHHFTVDSNNDGLTDILLPGIADQVLFQQQKNGSFVEYKISYKAELNTKAGENGVAVNFKLPNSPAFIDINGDNNLDAVFATKKGVSYFLATDKGYNNSQQLHMPITLPNVKHELVENFIKLEDFNRDGVVDLFTKTTGINATASLSSDGTKTTKIYLGSYKDNMLTFGTTPASEVTLEGQRTITDFPNLTGDEYPELAIIEMDIGFTDIISIASAAASGEAVEFDAEIHFYRGLGQHQFAEDAEIEKDFEIKMKVEGDAGKPKVTLKDFNGDGKTDLMLRTGDDELKIYYGEEKRLLSKKAKKIKQDLPENNENILTQDVNSDGKEDILIKLKDKHG